MARFTALAILLTLVVSAPQAASNLVEEGFEAFRQQRWAEAYELWVPEANSGNPRAQFYLSILLGEGMGVEQDPVSALTLLLLAADGGFAPAQFQLGTHYQFGRWVEQDMQSAIAWWLKAADQDHVKAQLNLGSVYYLGKGTAVDLEKAVAWYRRAANNGSDKARQTLERMKLDKTEVPPAPITPGAAENTGGGLQAMAQQWLMPDERLYGYPQNVRRYTEDPEVFLVSAGTAAGNRSPAAPVIALAGPVSAPTEQLSGEMEQVPAELAAPASGRRPAVDESVPEPQNSLLELSEADRQELNWIARQPPGNFTLQLFSSNRYASVKRFRETLETRAPKLIYPFGKPDNIWYGVIAGSYATRAELQAARREFAAINGIKNPWIRTFAEIRREYTPAN